MNWTPWRRQPEVKSDLVLGLSDATGKFLQFGTTTAATPASAINLYEQSTAVSVPINMVADSFSIMEPVLMRGDEMITEDPVLSFLQKPSPYYTRKLLFDVLGRAYLIAGEAICVGLGIVNRPPLELQPLLPDVVTVTQGAGGTVGRFSVSGNTLAGTYAPEREGNVVRYFDGGLREFKQIRSFSTKTNSLLRGQSLLVPAASEARQDILGTQHNVSLLEKGGRVSLVFHFKQDMDPDEFNEAKERVREQYGGATQAGEISVTAGQELEIKELSQSNRDMDFSNLQKTVKKSVALQYRVPLPLISDERATFNNFGIALLALYDHAVIPLAGCIFGGLSDFLLPRFGHDPSEVQITFNPDKITALVMRRNEELLKRAKLNVETDNELRKLIGREPYKGGDVVLKPANLIPVGSDLFTADNAPGVVRPAV